MNIPRPTRNATGGGAYAFEYSNFSLQAAVRNPDHARANPLTSGFRGIMSQEA